MRSLSWFLWTNIYSFNLPPIKKNTPENKCPNFHYTPSSTPETTPPHNIPPCDCCQPIGLPLPSCSLLLHPPCSPPPCCQLHILIFMLILVLDL